MPQNRKGDLVGHIKDLGKRGPYERAYATNEDLGFHTDSTDFVGLMCLRPALYGGESFVASSGLLYNFVVGEHPEYLPILCKNFPTDWRSEEPPGSPGWYLEPLYSYFGGELSATVRTGRAMSAMRFPEVPRLTADEVSCFTYFDSLPKRPGVALGMQLQTGDLQFVSNFVTVHTRTAFVDDAENPALQRHLLRLWISRPEPAGHSAPSTPPGAAAIRRDSYRSRTASVTRWASRGGTELPSMYWALFREPANSKLSGKVNRRFTSGSRSRRFSQWNGPTFDPG